MIFYTLSSFAKWPELVKDQAIQPVKPGLLVKYLPCKIDP